MDVHGIPNQPRIRPAESGGGRPLESEVRRSAKSDAAATPDAYAPSGALTDLARLIESSRNDPEVRADLVNKFKALMTIGALDTPAAAERAAASLLANPGA